MGRAKGVGMPKRQKTKVEGEGQRRSSGGRPRKRPVEVRDADGAAVGGEEAAAQPLDTMQPPAARPEPPPSQPPAASAAPERGQYRFWLGPARTLSWAELEVFLEEQLQRVRQARRYDNNACTCGGVSESGDANGHSMFCQIYKCYVHEMGCCDKISSSEEEWEYRCDCIEPAFDVNGSEYGMRERRFRQGWPGDLNWEWVWDRPFQLGRHTGACRCSKYCESYGRYVPLCPDSRHGVSGKRRGDLVAERRGYAMSDGSSWYGSWLPPHPAMLQHKDQCRSLAYAEWMRVQSAAGVELTSEDHLDLRSCVH